MVLEKSLKNGCNFFNETWTSPEIPYCSLVITLYPDLGRASDWLCCKGTLRQLIRSSTQIGVVTYHQYGMSVLTPLLSFCRETSGGVSKCLLISVTSVKLNVVNFHFFFVYSPLPITRTFKGNRKKVIGRSKQIAWSKGKTSFYCTVNILITFSCRNPGESILVQVSTRFELALVPVIGSRLQLIYVSVL